MIITRAESLAQRRAWLGKHEVKSLIPGTHTKKNNITSTFGIKTAKLNNKLMAMIMISIFKSRIFMYNI